MWKYFVLGVLAGWLLHWLIDWYFWRRSPAATDAVNPANPATGQAPDRPGVGTLAAVVSDVVASDAGALHAVAFDAGTTVTAGTTAGRVAAEVALGAPGAVSTSSATLTTSAPVYRQEDLEAIPGIGPRIGAMLRNNGITTFAELAATPVAELVRIVESTGEPASGIAVETWPSQARLAADQDWAGLAAFSRDRTAAAQDRR